VGRSPAAAAGGGGLTLTCNWLMHPTAIMAAPHSEGPMTPGVQPLPGPAAPPVLALILSASARETDTQADLWGTAAAAARPVHHALGDGSLSLMV